MLRLAPSSPSSSKFQERHVWPTWSVADAGMLSTANLTALNDADLRFIVGPAP